MLHFLASDCHTHTTVGVFVLERSCCISSHQSLHLTDQNRQNELTAAVTTWLLLSFPSCVISVDYLTLLDPWGREKSETGGEGDQGERKLLCFKSTCKCHFLPSPPKTKVIPEAAVWSGRLYILRKSVKDEQSVWEPWQTQRPAWNLSLRRQTQDLW